MKFLLQAARLTFFLCLLIPVTLSGQDADLDLHTERGNISNDGRIKLIWRSAGKETMYELQSARDPDFEEYKVIYSGPDRASFVSGLKNGTYYYRVKPVDGVWSKVLTVEVKHHSLRLAMALFVVGGIVFVLTVGVVVIGTIRTKQATA